MAGWMRHDQPDKGLKNENRCINWMPAEMCKRIE
jgi:hypothetical protein